MGGGSVNKHLCEGCFSSLGEVEVRFVLFAMPWEGVARVNWLEEIEEYNVIA